MDSQDLDVRRRRCLFRATHRGTKEMDWLLGRHAEARLPSAGETEVAVWERLVLVPDPQLYDWIVNGEPLVVPEFAAIITDIRAANGLSG